MIFLAASVVVLGIIVGAATGIGPVPGALCAILGIAIGLSLPINKGGT